MIPKPKRITIKFPEGTTYRYGFNFVDRNGTPVNLNGAKLTFSTFITSAPTSGIVRSLNTKHLGSGISILDILGGKIMVTFLSSETVDMAGTYAFELEIQEFNLDRYVACMGTLVILPARRLDTN